MSSNSAAGQPLGVASHRSLVQAAVLAPSPDNNQPWRFRWTAEGLEVSLDDGRSLPSDVNAMYDLMSMGAAIENVAIEAGQTGQATAVELVPGASSPAASGHGGPVAVLRFAPGGRPDPLHPYLATRCTNRKLYSRRSVEVDKLNAIGHEVDEIDDVQLDWVADRKTINTLGRLVAKSDRFRFEYQPFHGEIFRQLRFTEAEVKRTRDGLDFRTLEMPPGSSMVIRGLRSWRVMQWVNRLGFGRLLTMPSWLSVRKCGAIGVISVAAPSSQGFVTGGRALQRIWLACEAHNLAFHPLGSLPIFIGHMEQLGGQKLHAAHQQLSGELNKWFRSLVPTTRGRTLLMLFRIGYARRPQIQSLRRKVDELLA